MAKAQVYIFVFGILLFAFLATGFVFPEFLNLEFIPKVPFKLGLDLQGGIHLVYEADLSLIQDQDKKQAMDGLRDVIERRVNLFGVREPVVQVQGERLVVELAGTLEPSEAIRLIGETPFLEFRELKQKDTQEATTTSDSLEFVPTILTGRYLKKASVAFDQVGRPVVSLQFNSEGAKIFEKLTARNVGRPLAIYVDGILISSPVVQEAISGGKAQISGKFTIQEARELARNLSAGALPVPIKLISQQSVGPTLGKLSLEKSLKAGFVGVFGVILFMILFYRLPGLLASLALIIYILLNLTIFKIIPVTLTLAGIAGFILSIGMAVDANILIFSRMREELKSGQKPFLISIEEAFRRAWPSIRDSNLNTLIASTILFTFGTSFVKGFAFTLILGVLLSMFSAVFVTRNFIRLFQGSGLEKIKQLW